MVSTSGCRFRRIRDRGLDTRTPAQPISIDSPERGRTAAPALDRAPHTARVSGTLQAEEGQAMIRLLLFLAVYRLGRHVERHAVSSPPATTIMETADDRAATPGTRRRARRSRTPHRKRATGWITVRSWRRACPHCRAWCGFQRIQVDHEETYVICRACLRKVDGAQYRV